LFCYTVSLDNLRLLSWLVTVPSRSMPLLQTKLYLPRLSTRHERQSYVHRPRLMQALSAARSGKLTLISAPAGFGKTTLVSEWVAAPKGAERPAAWLSLDDGDNDPTRFLAYLITALQTIRANLGAGV